MGIADIQSPVTAPVNINHHLLSPGVLAVTGQRLNTERHTCRDGARSNLL